MNPLLMVILAFIIGFVEWFLAIRRTVAVVNGEKWLTFILVLVEGILAWLVLSSFLNVPSSPINNDSSLFFIFEFIIAYKWKIATAISASLGGALGSFVVTSHSCKDK